MALTLHYPLVMDFQAYSKFVKQSLPSPFMSYLMLLGRR